MKDIIKKMQEKMQEKLIDEEQENHADPIQLIKAAAAGDVKAISEIDVKIAEIKQGILQMEIYKNMIPDADANIKQMQAVLAMLENYKTPGITPEQTASQLADQFADNKPQAGGNTITCFDNDEPRPEGRGIKPLSTNKTMEFGSYPQAANGGMEKIKWRILEQKDGQTLLISEYILDYRPWINKPDYRYPKTGKREHILAAIISWADSDLRKWLNNEFYNQAFSTAEKKIILERLNTGNGAYFHKDYLPKKGHSANINPLTDDTYEKYEQRGCADTRDRVFLLNVEEAISFFKKEIYNIPNTKRYPNLDRMAKATEYTIKSKNLSVFDGGIWFGKEKKIFPELIGGESYWLRNLGANDAVLNNAAFHGGQPATIGPHGTIMAGGIFISVVGCGVRPCILIAYNG